jgi:RNA polymerase-binding transcription factor DksA
MGNKKPSPKKSRTSTSRSRVRPKAAPTARKASAPPPRKSAPKAAARPAAKSPKKPVKKGTAKPVKKAAQNPGPAKTVRQKTVVTKSTMSPPTAKSAKGGKQAAGAESAKQAAAKTPKAAKAAAPAPETAPEKSVRLSPDALRKQLVAKAKARAKSPRAVAFTLDDVRGELAKARPARKDAPAKAAAPAAKAPAPAPAKRVVNEIKPSHRRFGAASLADILGYNPTQEDKPEDEEATIEKKFLRFYRLLVQLRDHVKSGLALHAEDTLKRSSREDAGDLSGYGQHMADAGTDAFDRDFALSLVSNEQEALFEIEEAIKRIKNGTYGVCELTGKPINKERLLAVPFARYSVESQAEVEKTRRRTSQRGGLFGDVAGEEGAKIAEDDGD